MKALSAKTCAKIILLIIAFLFVVGIISTSAQPFCSVYPLGNNSVTFAKAKCGLGADSFMIVPYTFAKVPCFDSAGRIMYNRYGDSQFYYHNGLTWKLLTGSFVGVASISQAYGIIATPNPITTTGTIKADTTKVIPWADTSHQISTRHYVDSAVASAAGSTYTAGYAMNLVGFRFDLDTAKALIFTDTLAGRYLLTQYQASQTYLTKVANFWGVIIHNKDSIEVDTSKVTSKHYVDSAVASATGTPYTNGYGLTLASHIFAVDTGIIWNKRQVDSAILSFGYGTGTVTSVATYTVTGLKGGTITTAGTLYNDSTIIPKWDDTLSSNRFIVTPTYLNSQGYGTGTVTSVATYSVTGLRGGTITGSGTLYNDSAIIPKWDDTLSGNRFIVTPTYLASQGFGLGTVTSVALNGLSPLFTMTGSPITTSGTFAPQLSNAAAHTFFGNFTGSATGPSYSSPSLASADFANQGTATTLLHGNASGNPSFTQVQTGDIASNAITYVKLQAASTNSILIGSPSTGITLGEIALGAGLTMSGSTISATGSGGTVTTVTVNALSPLFTSVTSNPTTTPSTTFTLSNAAAHTFFGNFTGTSTSPSYSSPSLSSADFANQGTTTTVLHGNASGNPSWTSVGINDVSGSTGTGNFVFSASPALTGTPTAPTASPTDNSTTIATTAFVQNAVTYDPAKAECNYATTGALPAYTYNNGSSGVGATITGLSIGLLTTDGTSPAVGQSLLVKNETSTNTPYNGIYTVTANAIGVLYILARRSDFNQTSNITGGSNVFVASGSTLAGTTWEMNNNTTITVGTTNITWAQVGGAGYITATLPLLFTGTNISLPASSALPATMTIASPGNSTQNILTIDAAQTCTNKTIASSTDVLGGVTMTLGSDASLDMYYRSSGGVLTRLPVGTANQQLAVNSGATGYVWVGASGASTTLVAGTNVNIAGTNPYTITTVASVTPTANTIPLADANKNQQANNYIPIGTKIITSATIYTVTASSSHKLDFTGTTAQTVTMPVVSGLIDHQPWWIRNLSNQTMTINASNGSSLIISLGAGGTAILEDTIQTGTTNASWAVYTQNSGFTVGAPIANSTINTIPYNNSSGNIAESPNLAFDGTKLNYGGYNLEKIIAQSGTASANLTGSTSETNLAIVTIPAGVMSANARLKIEVLLLFTGTAGTKTFRLRHSTTSGDVSGGTNYSQVAAVAASLSASITANIWNTNSTSAQVGYAPASLTVGTSTLTVVTGALATTNISYLNLNGVLGNSGDAMQIVGYTVTLINP